METLSVLSNRTSKKALKTNVSTLERVLMITSGFYLLFNGLTNKTFERNFEVLSHL